MSKKHLGNLSKIIDRTGLKELKDTKIDIKHYFNGAAVYANSKICITLTPEGFAIKLPEHILTILRKRGAKPIKYFPKGHIKKDYVSLPISIVDNTKTLNRLIKTSVKYVIKQPRQP